MSTPAPPVVYTPGEVVFATPPKLNDGNLPITKTTNGKPGGHAIIIVSVDAGVSVTGRSHQYIPSVKILTTVPSFFLAGYMVTTFSKSTSLANVTLLDATEYKWFLPVSPATKESIHEVAPTSVAGPGNTGAAQWVNLKDSLTIPHDKVVRP